MKDYTLVDGRTSYTKISQYLYEKAEDEAKDSQPIIKVFAEAIQNIPDKTCDNVGCDAVNNLSQKQKHAVVLGEGDILEPPSLKVILKCCIRVVSLLVSTIFLLYDHFLTD